MLAPIATHQPLQPTVYPADLAGVIDATADPTPRELYLLLKPALDSIERGEGISFEAVVSYWEQKLGHKLNVRNR